MAIRTSYIFYYFFLPYLWQLFFSFYEYKKPSVRQYTYEFYMLFIQCV